MAVSHTRGAVDARTKTVTRRIGWRFLRPGDLLWLVNKSMGLAKGQKPQRLALVQVVDVRFEPLSKITDEDIAAEGVPAEVFAEIHDDTGLPPVGEWVRWFCEQMNCEPHTVVTRIEWRYLDTVTP
jgi:hypothetical protein